MGDHLPDEIREAYHRRLSRTSRDLEKIARLGRNWLEGYDELAEIWDLARFAHELAARFDPYKATPPVPEVWPPDDQ